MAKVTSRDVQEIVEKLSSDKVKAREEGIKLLNTWLEGERSYNFCKFIGLNTAKLRPDEIPHTETWPFLVSLLIKSASAEISSSKRRNPKVIYAKTLRIVVQRAEDGKCSGKMLPLSSVVKLLFNHVWDVLSNVLSFQSEYGIILRHLLSVRDYSFQMRRRVYCNLMFLYIEKVETSLSGKNISNCTSKEEVFRYILTLHSLLKYPPGDYPDNVRENIMKGFVRICSFIRDESKIARKLVECINTYLLNDGPNLGLLLLEIHNALQQFVFHCWLTTHDRVLKDSLVFYARIQLSLMRGAADRCLLVEQLLDVICKDLDQGSMSSTSMLRGDGNKDDKLGALSSSQCGLVELAAVLFYRACLNTTRSSLSEKRVKREPAAMILREALMQGKWLWNAAFCCLTRNFHTRICKDLFLYWFEGICMSFERIMNSSNVDRIYDGLLWTLRSLLELSSVLLLPNSRMELSAVSSSGFNEFVKGWQLLWSTIVHGLPIISNINALVDAALLLLSNITSNDFVNTSVIPQDVWDLQIFKRPNSISILYFFSCYFSRKNSHADLQDMLHLRKNLLRATLLHLNWKGCSMLNEQMALLIPSAMYALCVGYVPFTQCFKEVPLVHNYFDVTDAQDDSHKCEDPKYQCVLEFLDCSVEVLAEIEKISEVEAAQMKICPHVRVSRETSDQLLREMEASILGALVEEEINKRHLPDTLLICSLFSNLLYGYIFTRKINVSFCSKLSQYLQLMLDNAVRIIQEDIDLQVFSCLGCDPTCDDTSPLVSSVHCFLSSPICIELRDQNLMDFAPFGQLIHSVERLLKAFVNLYESYSQHLMYLQSDSITQDIAATDNIQSSFPNDRSISRIMDMELDVNDDSREVDTLPVGKKIGSDDSSSAEKRKMGMISLISSFFSASLLTWDILFKLMEKENDHKVRGKILYHLCQHPLWSSSGQFIDLVNVMNDIIIEQVGLRLACDSVLLSAHTLLTNLSALDAVGKEKCGLYLTEVETKQCFLSLGNVVLKLSEVDLDWFGRVKLIDSICNLVLLDPQIGQTMIERLLFMLKDMDYRVRLFLARRIGVLFQTWDGHEELFQDICVNFGVQMVVYSKGKVIHAKEVLAAGPQPQPIMETVVITLMHLALHSEKIELEAVFMICVVSAIDPCHRELVSAVLDNLSRELQYMTRVKYIEELLGSILFCWVACGVSLAALVETRHLFLPDVDPGYFLQYCCPWLLPALLINENSSDLNWVSKVTCQPLTVLIKNHFTSIFSISMALHCSKKPGSEKGTVVLQSSILHFAQITEKERDKLIKRHMVSIVSCILSLCSCSSNAIAPYFSRDIVSLEIQTIVDGFLDSDDNHASASVVDKINIFRPDRVFMFLVEVHYKIAAAAHYRHKCHRLAGIEVLMSTLGQRAAVLSTSNYLLNLIGSLIDCRPLQDQCCRILSALLLHLKRNISTDVTVMLGEQLQFLVSKLVACCIPSKTKVLCDTTVSQALSLLHMLTVDSDSSMYDYVKELEPFPKLKILDEIRKFHKELCHTYSIRDHLMKFVKKSCYLPPRLLLSSLQALHKKLLNVETLQRGGKVEGFSKDIYWQGDQEIVHAVWKLVHMCGSNDANEVRELVSDFISRVGTGDPYSVVFHLHDKTSHISVGKSIDTSSAIEISSDMDACLSEEHLVVLMKILMKYLMDDSVKIVDMASQTLRGILSTKRGQCALQSFDSYQRSLIEVHSKGVNIELVENLLLDLDRKSKAEAISLEKSTVWVTDGKTFEMWICPLVYSLIVYCSDVILRLCQDIIMFKGEVAEFLLPSIFVNITTRKDLEIDLHKLICLQLTEHIFTESNKLMKSIQVVLNCLNELRIRYVMQRSSFIPSKREVSKNSRPSSYSSKTRSTSAMARESAVVSNSMAKSPSSWEKVYWLSIDYLLVAKLAASCGSYFTSVMYVEHWCEDQFKTLTVGGPDFSHNEMLPEHIEILVSAVTGINEPDSLYGILQSHKLNSQIITFEHEGNWGKALEYYDLQVQSDTSVLNDGSSRGLPLEKAGSAHPSSFASETDVMRQSRPYKGLIRSLQQIGCAHVLDMYCRGLTSSKNLHQHDLEFTELQYESAWRAGKWDFSLPCVGTNFPLTPNIKCDHFNGNLHSCLRALEEGDLSDFQIKLRDSKQELVLSVSHASEESTEYIYLTIIKLQMLYHLGMAWDLRWTTCQDNSTKFCMLKPNNSSEPVIPSIEQLSWLDMEWCSILQRTQLHMNLLEPFIAFRRVLLQILSSRDCVLQHLLQSATTLRKGCRFSQAASALHEFKLLSFETKGQSSSLYWLGRLEEAKLFRAQGQNVMAINLAMYISQNYRSDEEASDAFRLIGKWLAETRSSNSRTILEKYLKPAVSIAEDVNATAKNAMKRKCQTHFHLAHYADALFRNHEERLNSNEWQAAMRLRKHKTIELEALIKRLRSSTKGEKIDYSMKIQELQKQVTMDKEEAQKLQDDRDNFLSLALEGYKRCLVIGDKYDLRVVFRIVTLWFSLSSKKDVVNSMLSTIDEVQSFKFIPLVYQIASRMGNAKDGHGHLNFQFALVSLVKKMAIDHPYHAILQLLALANGDRIKDKQRSKSSFVVDIDKKLAAENLLNELSSYHGAIIQQMKQMVEIYIRLAEMETKREDTNKKVTLPRDLRNLPMLELVPVVTATVSIDHSCQYREGTFPYFKGLADSVMIMNGINAPKVVECFGSDGCRYRQLAKSGNDDLRQDAVMEQFFGLVNTFLRNHQDTWKRRLGVRTYKVVPFTPSAGVLEWVNGTLPLGEYLIGSMRNGGAHGRYGMGDWSFLKCREHMANERDKRKAFQEVCNNFRPVMHYFFLERFLQPAEWFEKRLAYSRSVAASSMVGYIVGLGDRHSMNILIDQATAEVIHIDLGVAFEQGWMLKTPERVPFRLTRDIIDGMGVTGVEGVFRRCCEETLSVMRTNKEALLTIVEVFIHDPLYKWALSPLKALQRQKDLDDDFDTSLEEPQNDYQGNKDATRALLRVKQKLDGYEDGEMRSIHGQVQQLIQDAIDSERLCQMFPGWGAWL